jgi:cysteinyl-tRNA synthetase
MQYLNNLAPNLEPKATENIADIIAMIEKLIANNNAYEVDGHVYFSVKTFDDYGKLSKRIAGLKIGARIEASDLKNNQQDFILWKPSKELEDNSARFASPWGYGRPGWHIECSLMSSKFLGDSFDIHGGGADLKFPHHENEIAQSRSLKPDSYYAKYWVHNGFLTVNGEKMSKSLGNFITVRDLANKNISGFSLRFLLLSTHYRKPLDYSEKAINDAHKKIKFYHSLLEKYPQQQIINEDLDSNFLDPLLDDLNIAKALAYLHKLAKEIELNDTANKIIKFINIIRFLGLDNKGEKIQIPSNIKELVAKISVARLNKDYQEADRLREIIESNGYKLKYSKEGQIEIELI